MGARSPTCSPTPSAAGRGASELERAEIALTEIEASLGEARAELDRLAGELSESRREAAPALAAAVRERLAELAMPDAEFEVEVRPRRMGAGRAERTRSR